MVGIPLSKNIYTVTYDNGLDFAKRKCMARVLKADIYYSPIFIMEKTHHDNTDRLIKQYFLKSTGLSKIISLEVEFSMNRLKIKPLEKHEVETTR